jgi:hypothetical protein
MIFSLNRVARDVEVPTLAAVVAVIGSVVFGFFVFCFFVQPKHPSQFPTSNMWSMRVGKRLGTMIAPRGCRSTRSVGYLRHRLRNVRDAQGALDPDIVTACSVVLFSLIRYMEHTCAMSFSCGMCESASSL